jgi:hypothetical protein
MSEFNVLPERIAAQTIRERVERAERARMAGRARRSRRHTLASGLHRLAERIDN